ncbi:hypothetical protein HDU76_011612 [Blyttiomyces sp. JEL0837]|nr:hypothetical protein HDU76_011612 [Blyttiomyces sp. JEL0837]
MALNAQLLEQLLGKLTPVLTDYLKSNEDQCLPVAIPKTASELRSQFPRSMQVPETGAKDLEEFMTIVKLTLEHSVRTGSPRFLDKLYAGSEPIGQVSELITAILNTNVHVFSVSPVFTLMELSVIRSLSSLLSFKKPSGILQPGGSASNHLAMVTARAAIYPHHRLKGAARTGEILTVLTSEAGHYSIDKAAGAMGIGLDSVLRVPITKDGRMEVEQIKNILDESRVRGELPYFINLTAGTTVLSAFDPIRKVVEVVREYEREWGKESGLPHKPRIWIHVDGSYGGPAVFSERWRTRLLDGCEDVDSFTLSPHKILGVPQQCSALLINGARWGRRVLWRSNGLKADYLFHGDHDQSVGDESIDPEWEGEEDGGFMMDLGDATIGCGRRADSLKLFMTWSYYGTKEWAARVDLAFSRVTYLREWLAAPQLQGRFRMVLGSETTEPEGRLTLPFWCISSSVRKRFGSLEGFFKYDRALAHEVLAASTRAVHAEMTRRGRFMIDFMGLKKPEPLPAFIRVAISSPNFTEQHIEELVSELIAIVDLLEVVFRESDDGVLVVDSVKIR